MTQKPLEPPDLKRCQADKPGPGPFALGGELGDPNNGWRVRCKNEPVVIATEKKPGEDGRVGSMSLCEECKDAMLSQLGEDFAAFKPVKEETMDPNANLKEMLELAEEVAEPGNYRGDGAAGDYTSDAVRLAELIQALDEWLHEKRGFLPKRWRRAAKEPPRPRQVERVKDALDRVFRDNEEG